MHDNWYVVETKLTERHWMTDSFLRTMPVSFFIENHSHDSYMFLMPWDKLTQNKNAKLPLFLGLVVETFVFAWNKIIAAYLRKPITRSVYAFIFPHDNIYLISVTTIKKTTNRSRRSWVSLSKQISKKC